MEMMGKTGKRPPLRQIDVRGTKPWIPPFVWLRDAQHSVTDVILFKLDGCNMSAYNVIKRVDKGFFMEKASTITVRVKQDTRTRLDAFAGAVKRSKSYVIEEALEQYLEINEWQIKGIQEALADADSPDAVFADHDEVLADREAKVARKMA